jgi:tRNA acetyltransferase TAN1
LDLIVTCARHFEGEAKEEITGILDELGDPSADVSITDMSGILTVQTSVNSVEIIKKIREKLEDEPWSIRYTLRAIPIFQTVSTDVESITDAALSQIQKIKPDETYRITIEKRNSGISSSGIISQIADKIKNKVSLEKYDWIILVEILGSVSGVSVLKDADVLSVERTKRESVE